MLDYNDNTYGLPSPFTHFVNDYSKSVYKILTVDPFGDEIIIAGFLVSSHDRYFLATVSCMIDGDDRTVKRIFSSDNKELPWHRVHSCKTDDIALIEVDANLLPCLALPISFKFSGFEDVVTIGYEHEDSLKDAEIQFHKGYIYPFTPYSESHSQVLKADMKWMCGGPVIDRSGSVVGILAGSYEDDNDYYVPEDWFVVTPSKYLESFLKEKTEVVSKKAVVHIK